MLFIDAALPSRTCSQTRACQKNATRSLLQRSSESSPRKSSSTKPTSVSKKRAASWVLCGDTAWLRPLACYLAWPRCSFGADPLRLRRLMNRQKYDRRARFCGWAHELAAPHNSGITINCCLYRRMEESKNRSSRLSGHAVGTG